MLGEESTLCAWEREHLTVSATSQRGWPIDLKLEMRLEGVTASSSFALPGGLYFVLYEPQDKEAPRQCPPGEFVT